MWHWQWPWVRLEELGTCTPPQIYIIPSMHTVWAEKTVRTQLNSPRRIRKPAKEGGSYVEPSLDMEIPPSSALYHQVTLLRAREVDLNIEQKRREKQKKVETCSLKTFRVTFGVTRNSIACVTSIEVFGKLCRA